jgi:hypothetical protein
MVIIDLYLQFIERMAEGEGHRWERGVNAIKCGPTAGRVCRCCESRPGCAEDGQWPDSLLWDCLSFSTKSSVGSLRAWYISSLATKTKTVVDSKVVVETNITVECLVVNIAVCKQDVGCIPSVFLLNLLFFKRVTSACCLLPDFDSLEHGADPRIIPSIVLKVLLEFWECFVEGLFKYSCCVGAVWIVNH